MSHIIGRRGYVSETYPEPPRASGSGGAVVRMGFDNSTDVVSYAPGGPTVLLRFSDGPPISVTLTGYKPGNLILIQYSVMGIDDVPSGSSGSVMVINPIIDLGSGPRAIHGQSSSTNGGFGTAGTAMPPNSVTTFVIPVPEDVLADPIVQLSANFAGGDPTDVFGFQALLAVSEIAASSITQAPTTFLDP